ncbi:hypothetical protein [Flavobacterium sp. NKUCC04_CG]|uniref:hypothetical protein n=1 Tax=Flavobacterium sp. NKUCC04_CG TaxID=2842121 RepID=UPI001C5B807F|nr:hypothetical protein [Flavobacterium sp. NKUCC04_CG]MBW3519922.1 hypothetical protein [Flavobacterium sp. NKUCC04_CG]
MKKIILSISLISLVSILCAADQHNETMLIEDLKKSNFCVVYLAHMNNAGTAMIVNSYRVKKDGRTCSEIEQMFDEHFNQ